MGLTNSMKKAPKVNGNNGHVNSTHRCCAERRLLEAWVADARRHGVPAARVVSWVRRKFGAHMTVYRCRKDGSLGCSTPCLLCSRELARFDIKVHCSLEGGAWYSGRVTDVGAPAPILTSGQRRMIKGKAACMAERTLKTPNLAIPFR
ncbi:hypothetical protein F751_3401 [Auxenochlorella protothecoides]|uniref:Uncharacterized protein n=2 Tax=Auxenochlorella protothecoides TaxID=3075 RepID=A0A087SBV6_AUXPR|nr:hypothetical protein F751_3401 [Auxenochlorella protothecoides]KFM23210.1 hypothetical protein F751_3401 [Auxenochlorella protothecoides]RMZ53585.1 hypothetical protein APUTEX25_003407 [Auxenochlorella protothecoides]|eukprot:RMZ53585.1 hypothetical protein APUTEX25_003407 [Auxenochlorella protothecoides]